MRRVVLGGCLLLGLGAALSVAGFAIASRSATRAAKIDQRLILHPHTARAGASQRGLGVVRLQVYPAIPGPQHVELALPPAVHASSVSVRAAVVGMRMSPVLGTLRRQGDSYRGTLNLSMFGLYRLRVHLQAGWSPALRVAISLPAS